MNCKKCECKNITPQSQECYDQMIMFDVEFSDRKICIDPCLTDEIQELWQEGVITTGSCCGHNKVEPFINVDTDSEILMIGLNYEFWMNESDVKCFRPKSIKGK